MYKETGTRQRASKLERESRTPIHTEAVNRIGESKASEVIQPRARGRRAARQYTSRLGKDNRIGALLIYYVQAEGRTYLSTADGRRSQQRP